MNWKKLLGLGAAGAGAFFTGGGSLASIPGILNAAGRVAPILTTAAKGRGDAQQANETLKIAAANQDINRRTYQRDSPAARLRSSTRASMVANRQPTKVTGVGTPNVEFSGGFSNPDMYSPETKQLANMTIHNHLVSTLNGDDTIAPMDPVGKESTFDKILGYGGVGLSILDAIRKKNAGGVMSEDPNPIYRPDQ